MYLTFTLATSGFVVGHKFMWNNFSFTDANYLEVMRLLWQ